MSLTSKDKRDIYLHSPPAASLGTKFLDGKAAMLFLTAFRGQNSTCVRQEYVNAERPDA